jgi:hypothetical protein
MRNAYKILVIKYAGKRPFGRPQAYNERKILKMDFGVAVCGLHQFRLRITGGMSCARKQTF